MHELLLKVSGMAHFCSSVRQRAAARRSINRHLAAALASALALSAAADDVPTDSGGDSAGLIPLPERFHYDIDDTTVTVGHGFGCAISGGDGGTGARAFTPGSIVCWGTPHAARMGSLSPPGGLYAQLSAAEHHACGVRADDGGIGCWGGAFRGVAIPGGGYTQVTAGGSVVCGLAANGSAACYGASNMGQTGPPRDARFVQLSCGKATCCGLTTAGGLLCWGSNYANVASPPNGSFVQLSLSSDATACALDADGAAVCWGAVAGPHGGVVTLPGGPYAQVATSSALTCAIRADGTLQCWGEAPRAWKSPTAPPRDTRFLEVSAHDLDICGVTADPDGARLLCWGATGPELQSPPELLPVG